MVAPTTAPPRRGVLDLTDFLDCAGITPEDGLGTGAFNIWSNTFPAAELPARGSDVVVDGVPFRFPAEHPSGADNVRCARQLVPVPRGRYDWIHVLAAAERRTEDEVLLHFADGSVDAEWLRVSDFWPETPARFGESAAFRCTRLHYPRHVQRNMGPVIWRRRVAVPREEDLVALRLPDNPAVHVFALTLEAA
ncbi:hypothetical protein [Actinosynnema sp. NPDC020468]|uniref:hypothetical protein n=1 Tax=Actinosynnema sp. NPDC020468 TaxID=3154488 RepID=UPI0033C08257